MSKKDRIKTTLDFLKSLLFAFLMALFGVVGYAFVHIESLTKLKISLLAFSIVLIIVVITFIVKSIISYLDKLEMED